jgi:hypothetical protein
MRIATLQEFTNRVVFVRNHCVNVIITVTRVDWCLTVRLVTMTSESGPRGGRHGSCHIFISRFFTVSFLP